MDTEERIALDCPCCGETIFRPLSWFKKACSTCPACDAGLAAGQFADAVNRIEQAFDASVEEFVHGKPSSGCCGRH